MGNQRLYVDLNGQIWKGYVESEGTMHYARLTGVTNGQQAGVIQPIWTFERSEADKTWLLIGDSI